MGDNRPNINFRCLQAVQLMEIDACIRCGECEKWCPMYNATGDTDIAPRSKIDRWRQFVNQNYGLRAKLLGPRPVEPAAMDEFKNDLYTCTTCGICEVVCPVHINTVELWEAMRANLVLAGVGPYGKQGSFPKIIKKFKNPYMADQKDRTTWIPDDVKIEPKAEIAYFAGCTAGLRGKQEKLAVATMRILNAAGIPFTYLGEEEECCGSVLIRTGQSRTVDGNVPQKLAEHNVYTFERRGVKKVLFSCAGCFRTAKVDWGRQIGRQPKFECIHVSDFLAELIRAGKIQWEKGCEQDYTVTYHDPCHLRHLGVFEGARYILEHIPGVRFVEMEHNKNYSRCCGAGGGVKSGLPEVALSAASLRCEDADAVGANILSSACPFCRRNLSDGRDSLVKQGKLADGALEVEDMIVLVARAMGLDTEPKR